LKESWLPFSRFNDDVELLPLDVDSRILINLKGDEGKKNHLTHAWKLWRENNLAKV